jgi:hypothetical protein
MSRAVTAKPSSNSGQNPNTPVRIFDIYENVRFPIGTMVVLSDLADSPVRGEVIGHVSWDRVLVRWPNQVQQMDVDEIIPESEFIYSGHAHSPVTAGKKASRTAFWGKQAPQEDRLDNLREELLQRVPPNEQPAANIFFKGFSQQKTLVKLYNTWKLKQMKDNPKAWEAIAGKSPAGQGTNTWINKLKERDPETAGKLEELAHWNGAVTYKDASGQVQEGKPEDIAKLMLHSQRPEMYKKLIDSEIQQLANEGVGVAAPNQPKPEAKGTRGKAFITKVGLINNPQAKAFSKDLLYLYRLGKTVKDDSGATFTPDKVAEIYLSQASNPQTQERIKNWLRKIVEAVDKEGAPQPQKQKPTPQKQDGSQVAPLEGFDEQPAASIASSLRATSHLISNAIGDTEVADDVTAAADVLESLETLDDSEISPVAKVTAMAKATVRIAQSVESLRMKGNSLSSALADKMEMDWQAVLSA